ncbi:tRNA-guanine(34) transglycosylase, partial [Bertholletia excelsa]
QTNFEGGEHFSDAISHFTSLSESSVQSRRRNCPDSLVVGANKGSPWHWKPAPAPKEEKQSVRKPRRDGGIAVAHPGERERGSGREMKFAVKALSGNGRARAGVLRLGFSFPSQAELEIDTPALLLSTRKGLPLFISQDLLSSLPSPESHLLQFSPLHFLEGPSWKTISNIGGLHQMLGLQEYGFVAVPRDSIVCLPECDSTNKIGASFETPCGRSLIKPLEYIEMISAMKPNLWAALADEVPAWVSEKRNKTSVDRTVKWLDDCITLSSSSAEIFGAVVGGSSVEERRRCAQEVAKRNVSGFNFSYCFEYLI